MLQRFKLIRAIRTW